MSLYYTNRKGHNHYLRAATTKKGGTRYYTNIESILRSYGRASYSFPLF